MKPGGARNKGASAEREIIKLLEPIIRDCGQGALFRNLEQTRSGGHDIIGIDWLAIEVKRCETLSVDNWWKQTVEQAERLSQFSGKQRLPILIYRQSRKPWTVVMWGTIQNCARMDVRVTISFDDFCAWLRKELS